MSSTCEKARNTRPPIAQFTLILQDRHSCLSMLFHLQTCVYTGTAPYAAVTPV